MKWILPAVLLLSACGLLNEPEVEFRPVLAAIAGFNADDPHILIEPAARGARVTIHTYGSSCNAKASTQVNVSGMTATVAPFNLEPANRPCLADLVVITHEALIAFPQGGTATILVRGINTRSGVEPNLRTDTMVVERTVAIP